MAAVLDQISLPGGFSNCDSELESMCVAKGETLQSVDIDHYTSTTDTSDDEDDIFGDQDEGILVDVSPDWPEDAFKDRMTNRDILQTWRENFLRIIDEENRRRSRLQECPEEIHSMFEDDMAILSWLQEWPEKVTEVFSTHQEEIENANECPESSSNDQPRPPHVEGVSFVRLAARALIPAIGLFL